ncbi:DUF4192 domain-containing protein [Nocardia sp. IFM 10818]
MNTPEFRFAETGKLVAAIPAMLKFTPESSLIFLFMAPAEKGMAVQTVARLDIAAFRDGRPGSVAAHFGHLAPMVMLLVVDERARARRDRYSADHQQILGQIEAEFAVCGVRLVDAVATPAIAAQAPWWSLTKPENTGTVADPTTLAFTAAMVAEGRPVSGTRAEIEARFAPDTARRAAVAGHLTAAMQEGCDQLTAAVAGNTFDEFAARQLAEVLDKVHHYDPDTAAEPADVAFLAARIGDPAVRDELFQLCGTEHADRAEALWLDLTRCLPGPARSVAATLYGFSAYVLRQDGVTAAMAFDIATAEDPDNRMARLLSHAIEYGVAPNKIREKFGIAHPVR